MIFSLDWLLPLGGLEWLAQNELAKLTLWMELISSHPPTHALPLPPSLGGHLNVQELQLLHSEAQILVPCSFCRLRKQDWGGAVMDKLMYMGYWIRNSQQPGEISTTVSTQWRKNWSLDIYSYLCPSLTFLWSLGHRLQSLLPRRLLIWPL